jgi:hypothetical protein
MEKHNQDSEKSSYLPIIVVVMIALFIGLSLQWGKAVFVPMQLMTQVMGVFFILLAMFKLFDLSGFADGFRMYDIIAKRLRVYAYIYPFIELILGALYLSSLHPFLTNSLTIIVMTVSASGVFISIKRGYKFKCACLGTVLNVPLSTVSLIENLGMGLMAIYMLIGLIF